MALRKIFAAYDAEGVYVYQAYGPLIGEYALKHGRFGEGYKLDRMTWIKPSFGWMLYRCGYAAKPGQEFVLKIKLSYEGFRTILSRAVPSSYEADLFADQAAWQTAVKRSDVRFQWDPDRTLRGGVMERRAIGHDVANKRADLPPVPDEREYPVDDELGHILMLGDR